MTIPFKTLLEKLNSHYNDKPDNDILCIEEGNSAPISQTPLTSNLYTELLEESESEEDFPR